MDFNHVDLTGYLHTACIHMIASYLDGWLYTLCASWSFLIVSIVGLRGFHCPWSWVNGFHYLPHSSLLPIRMGLFWHVLSVSFSLYTVTTSLVKMDTLPSSAVFPTLISEVGNSLNVSISAALLDSCGNDSVLTYLPSQASQLANPTFLSDILNIGRPNFVPSFYLR